MDKTIFLTYGYTFVQPGL